MPPRSYHESLWEGVPRGAEPVERVARERFLLAHLESLGERQAAPPRVLDLGCGEGFFAGALTRAGARVVAADVADEPLRRLRERYGTLEGLDTELLRPEAPLPFAEASFDAVWAGETIEHVADTAGWLSEVRRVLRSGGLVLLSTPDHGLVRRLGLALAAGAFERHFDPRADHLRFYTRRTLARLLADFGFEEVVTAGAGGVPGARRVLLASGRRKRF